MEEDNKFRSLERFAREIMEGTLGVGRTMGSRSSAFRQSSSSGTSSGSHTHGIDVGARRNYAHEKAATKKAEENKRKREQEITRRENEAEQRRKESEQRSKQMANEETIDEAKGFVYDKPSSSIVSSYRGHSTEHLKDMHSRWSADHADKKSKPSTSDKLLAVHHVLKSRGENVGELPRHPSLGMRTYSEETNSEKRRKVVNVARPGDADPRSEKSKLAKHGEIKTKIVDEGESDMLTHDKKFGLSDSLIHAAKSIMEKKDSVIKGGKTEVDLEPRTDDTVDQEDDKKSSKKTEKKCDDCGEPMSKCDCDDHDHDDDKKKKSVKESAEGTAPKTAKEKKLAALSAPKDKITHKDVLVGRGVVKEGLTDEEIEFLEMIARELDVAESINEDYQEKANQTAMASAAHREATRELGGIPGGHHHDAADQLEKATKHYESADREASKGRHSAAQYYAQNAEKHVDMAKMSHEKAKKFGSTHDDPAFHVNEEIDEGKRKRVPTQPTSTSAPIRGANQDQSGHGVSRNVADYTISDEFVEEEEELDEARGRPRLPRDEHGKVIRDPAKIAAHRAATDTKKAESPHIVDQLRGVISSGGKQHVTFKSGETKNIGVNHAKAGLLIHHASGKPAEKAKMANRLWHSHGSFMSALRGEKAPEPKVKRAAGKGSTSLPPLKSVEKPGSAMSAKTIKRTAQAFAAYRAKKNK